MDLLCERKLPGTSTIFCDSLKIPQSSHNAGNSKTKLILFFFLRILDFRK